MVSPAATPQDSAATSTSALGSSLYVASTYPPITCPHLSLLYFSHPRLMKHAPRIALGCGNGNARWPAPSLTPPIPALPLHNPWVTLQKNKQPPRICTAVTRRIQTWPPHEQPNPATPSPATSPQLRRMRRRLARQPAEARRLDAAIDANLDSLGFISNQEDAE